MRNLFSKQMEQLHVELIEMGALCEQAISRAYQVLMEEDPKAAQPPALPGSLVLFPVVVVPDVVRRISH